MYQCANKVVSDDPGLVDFAVGVVNSALSVLGNSKYRRSVINPAQQFFFFCLVKMTFGLVHATYNFPVWEAVIWLALNPGVL